MWQQSDRTVRAMVVLWLCLSSAALYALADYGTEEGAAGPAPSQWPASLPTGITPSENRATVVLFAHPLCPCTRATLVELESLTNRLFGLLDLHVLFYEPSDMSGMPDVWAASDLRQLASTLPGTQLHADVDGQLAQHFGAYTSGQVLLYDTTGTLRFAGGITPSRGHTGSNLGRATLISTILSDSGVDPLKPVINPVFGCGLLEEQDGDRKSPLGSPVSPQANLPANSPTSSPTSSPGSSDDSGVTGNGEKIRELSVSAPPEPLTSVKAAS